MQRPALVLFLIAFAVASVGCPGPTTTSRAKVSAPPSPLASATAAAPTPSPVATSLNQLVVDLDGYTGQVLDLSGAVAANVAVTGIIANNGGGVLGNNGGNLVGEHGGGWQLLQAAATQPITATTDDKGRFKLAAPAGATLNVEASQKADVKAFKFGVAPTGAPVVLKLAKTGTVTGRVSAPGVTDYLGVDVFVPGTSYGAKADAGGKFTLTNVPVGAFPLVAQKAPLGRANKNDVQVASERTTDVGELALVASTPAIAAIEPANGGPGATVKLRGEHFGKSTGDTLVVSFQGVIATKATRQDDGVIDVIVPDGASSGDVVVTVGGAASNAARFQVLKALVLSPNDANVVLGTNVAYKAKGTDTAGEAVASPTVAWSLTGAGASVDAAGLVRGSALGDATLTAASGSVKATLALHVIATLPPITTFAGTDQPGYKDGVPRAEAQFRHPVGLALDAAGTLYVADQENNAIRTISAAGLVATLAGGLGQGSVVGDATTARFNRPAGVAVAAGVVYVTDSYGNRVVKIDTALPPTDGNFVSLLAGSTQGSADGAANAAQFYRPVGIAVWPGVAVFVADENNDRVRKIDLAAVPAANGFVSTFAGGLRGNANGLGGNAQFNNADGVAVAADGTVYVADTANHRIRKAAPNGTVTTLAGSDMGFQEGVGVAAKFNAPTALAVDAAGNVYVADTGNNRIRKVTPSGQVFTVAGSGSAGFADGEGTSAQFNAPAGIVVAADGTIYVADSGNHRIRKLKP